MAYAGATADNLSYTANGGGTVYPEGYWTAKHPSKHPISYSAFERKYSSDAGDGNYWRNKFSSRDVSSYVTMLEDQKRITEASSGNIDANGQAYQDKRDIRLDEKERSHVEALNSSREFDVTLSREKDPYKRREIIKARVNSEEFIRRNDEVAAERVHSEESIQAMVKRIIIEKELERQGILPPTSGRVVSAPAL